MSIWKGPFLLLFEKEVGLKAHSIEIHIDFPKPSKALEHMFESFFQVK